MKKMNTILLALLLTFSISHSTVIAQNDTMYVMKSGVIVGKYNVNNQVDSVIFYKPTLGSSTTVTDYDGNVYNTVTIGTQIWMKENLKTTHYADGIPIQLVTGDSNWDTLSTNDKAYCWYNDDSTTYAKEYGALYTWTAAVNDTIGSTNNPSGIQGACPNGWHIPSYSEWEELIAFLGDRFVAGGKLKEVGYDHWQTPNEGATNESGFTALPSGVRNDGGEFHLIGLNGLWWCATEWEFAPDTFGWWWQVSYNVASVVIVGNTKEAGKAVRCIKD